MSVVGEQAGIVMVNDRGNQQGWSLPFTWIILFVVVALVYFFGWMGLVYLAAASLLMTVLVSLSEVLNPAEADVSSAVEVTYQFYADSVLEDVAEIFQIVFEKLPGVEMQDAEPEPETLYSPGAEGRPQAGFRLEELKDLIRKVLAESV